MFCGFARDNTIVGSPSCIHVGKYVLAMSLTSRRRRAGNGLATVLECMNQMCRDEAEI
jgi:hypothetical protein